MEFTLDLIPGTDIQNASIPFLARSAVVDNTTGQWWYVPQASQFIPPYSVGTVLSFSAGIQTIAVTNTTPTGVISTPITSERGHITLYDTPQNAASGIAVPMTNTLSGSRFTANETWTTPRTDEVIFAAPLKRFNLMLTTIVFGTAVAGQMELHGGTGGGAAEDIFGPFPFAANGGISLPHIDPPLEFPEENPIRITTLGTGLQTIFIAGFTRKI